MMQLIVRFGLIGAAILIGVNVLLLLIMGLPQPEDYDLGEVIGYTTIVVSLIPVFFAMKYYRDYHTEGRLTFWRGLGIGAAVAAWPAVAFGIYNWIYVTVIDPEFSETYMRHTLDKARAEMSASEFAQYASQIESQSALMTNPAFMALLMFMTVFLIGVLIAFVSALILQKRTRAAVSCD